MVAQDMDHIRICQVCRSKERNDIIPVLIAGRIIHSVTGLNAERIIFSLDIAHQSIDIGQVIGLNITQYEEFRGIPRLASGKGLLFRPLVRAADTIPVSCRRFQILQRDAVDSHRGISILGECAESCLCRSIRPFRAVTLCVLNLLLVCLKRIAQPGNALLRAGICYCIILNAIGQTGIFSLGSIAGYRAVEGNLARIILGINHVFSSSFAEHVGGQCARITSLADLSAIFQIDTDASCRSTIRRCNLDNTLCAKENRIRRNQISSRNRNRFLRCREGIHGVVQDIGTCLDGICKFRTLLQSCRNLYRNRCYQIIRKQCTGGTCCINRDGTGHLVIFAGSLIAVGKCDCIVLKRAAELQRSTTGIHRTTGGSNFHINRFAEHCRILLRCNLNGRCAYCRIAVYCKAACLRGFIAEPVTNGYRDGMLSIEQADIIQMVFRAIRISGIAKVVVTYNIHAVQIHANCIGINAAGIFVFHIVE